MEESPSRLPKPMSSSLPPKKDASKRRSLLLPPGTISGAARRGLLSPTEEEPPKRRPLTMIGTMPGTLRGLDQEESENSSSPSPDGKEKARAGAHAALTGASRGQAPTAAPAPRSGIARSTSVRAQGFKKTGTAGARNPEPGQSKIGTRPASMLKERTTRPDSAASTTSRTAAEASTTRLRAPAASAVGGTGLRKPASTTSRHTRTQSALPSASTNAALPRTDVRRHPTISEGTESKLHRPAFSTLQQHYTPKKNLAPKPASSSLIHAQPIETGSSSLNLDTQFVQTRLLQLILLHRQAEPTYQAWELSARRKLKHKFTDVAAECEVVREKEKDWRRRVNTGALKDWCKGDMGLLAENISALSNVVTEITQLVEDGGRVHQALEMFEAWITWVEAIYQGRERQHNRAEFIDGLGDGWKSEVAALLRKLSSLGRQLDGFGKVEEGSNLHDILFGFRTLTRGAVDELKAVEGLENEVVKRERTWIDEQVGGLESEIDSLLA